MLHTPPQGVREPSMRHDEMTLEHQMSEVAKNVTEKLRDGKLRQALVRRARRLETARQINQWHLSSEPEQAE
jgi:hypothetical protein